MLNHAQESEVLTTNSAEIKLCLLAFDMYISPSNHSIIDTYMHYSEEGLIYGKGVPRLIYFYYIPV